MWKVNQLINTRCEQINQGIKIMYKVNVQILKRKL